MAGKKRTAVPGEKVLARRPDGGDPELGEFTFKRWEAGGRGQQLVPMSANPIHRPIPIGRGDEIEIIARFIKVLERM